MMKLSRMVLKLALPACLAVAPIAVGATSALAEDIDSREYKVMLDASKFTGAYEGDLGVAIADLQASLADKIEEAGLELEKELEPEEIRFVRFLDTKDKDLRTHGFVLRQRGDLELDNDGSWVAKDGKTKYTLKYRNLDQSMVAGQDVHFDKDIYDELPSPEADVFAECLATKDEEKCLPDKIKLKFEEDVTIGASINDAWVPIYSYSGTGRDDLDLLSLDISDLSWAAVVFPGLEKGLAKEGYHIDENIVGNNAPALDVVNLTIHERTYEGAEVDLGAVDADVVLTVWYETGSDYTTPAVVELSFDYKTDDEDEDAIANAEALYGAILSLDLIDLDSTTKTAFVYSYNDNEE